MAILEPGDVVIYQNLGHNSNGSMAVVERAYKWRLSQLVDVQWITVTGICKSLTPDRYNVTCFEKVGHVSDLG